MTYKRILKSTLKYAAIASFALAFAFSFFAANPASAATMPWSGQGGPQGGHGMMMGSRSGAHPGIFGTVSAVNGLTLTVTSKSFGRAASTTPTTYTVDASNATVKKANATSTVSSIAVGDTVMVQGTVSGSSVTATAIFDNVAMAGGRAGSNGKMGNSAHPTFIGSVTAVNGSTLSITSKVFGRNATTTTTYSVDASNAVIMKAGATSTVSSIAVGDTVIVSGTVSGTSVTATMVRDGVTGNGNNPVFTGNGQPIVAGTVSSVNGSSIVITNKGNVQYTIDASNAKIEKGNVASSISNVSVGDSVIVQGTVNGTSVTAVNVLDQTTSSTGSKGASHGIFSAIGSFFSHLFGF